MRVIPFKKEPAAAATPGHECAGVSDTPEPGGFWHRLAASIDSLAVYPVKRALSDRDVVQVDAEIERCRQLMSGRRSPRSATVVPFSFQPHRVLVPVKVRS